MGYSVSGGVGRSRGRRPACLDCLRFAAALFVGHELGGEAVAASGDLLTRRSDVVFDGVADVLRSEVRASGAGTVLSGGNSGS